MQRSLGYDGSLTWNPGVNNTVEITMPMFPLDNKLRCAWSFKFESVSSA